MEQEFLIGLDVGTTSSKAVVFTPAGRVVASGRAATSWIDSRNGAETDGRSLVDSARSALAAALRDTPSGHVLGIGITSIAESGVLIDSSGAPIGPVIAWHDRRDTAELDQLGAEIGAGRFSAITGLPFREQWSLTKHRWIMRNVSEATKAVRRFNVAEWIALSLGAAEVTDVSLASRTGWYNVRGREWWNDTLEWSGITRRMLPEIVTAGTSIGRVRASDPLQRLRGAVLTTAGQDHQAAAVGLGAIGAGDEVDSCGTAEALVRAVDPIDDSRTILDLTDAGITVGWHVAEGRWSLLGGTEGGLLLGRVLKALGVSDFEHDDLDQSARNIAIPDISAQLDDSGRIVLNGIGDSASPAGVWRAIIELVTDQAATIHDAMSVLTGPHHELLVTGGWAKSAALLDSKRRRLGPLSQPGIEEAGTHGAAILAGVASGLWATPGESSFGTSP